MGTRRLLAIDSTSRESRSRWRLFFCRGLCLPINWSTADFICSSFFFSLFVFFNQVGNDSKCVFCWMVISHKYLEIIVEGILVTSKLKVIGKVFFFLNI